MPLIEKDYEDPGLIENYSNPNAVVRNFDFTFESGIKAPFNGLAQEYEEINLHFWLSVFLHFS